jgi:hypothetical protein
MYEFCPEFLVNVSTISDINRTPSKVRATKEAQRGFRPVIELQNVGRVCLG